MSNNKVLSFIKIIGLLILGLIVSIIIVPIAIINFLWKIIFKDIYYFFLSTGNDTVKWLAKRYNRK